MDVNSLIQSAMVTLVPVALKVAGAFVLWLIGRWLIGFSTRTLGKTLTLMNTTDGARYEIKLVSVGASTTSD